MKNIKETEELFDEIFKESLENVSTPVPSGVWEGISSSIGSSGAAAGIAAKTALWMKAAIAVVSISAIAVVAYQIMDSKESKIESETPAITQENNPVIQTEIPLTNESKDLTNSNSNPVNGDQSNVKIKNEQELEKNDGANDAPSKEPVKDISSGPDQKYSIDANNVIKIEVPDLDEMAQKKVSDKEAKHEGKEAEVVVQPEEPIEYRYIKDSSYIFIPNAFTSNGDGINDTYLIKIVGEESFEMIISTLDNQILYRTTNKYQGWNCKLPNGEIAPAGAYLVKVIYKFKGSEVKTDIRKLTLIK